MNSNLEIDHKFMFFIDFIDVSPLLHITKRKYMRISFLRFMLTQRDMNDLLVNAVANPAKCPVAPVYELRALSFRF